MGGSGGTWDVEAVAVDVAVAAASCRTVGREGAGDGERPLWVRAVVVVEAVAAALDPGAFELLMLMFVGGHPRKSPTR